MHGVETGIVRILVSFRGRLINIHSNATTSECHFGLLRKVNLDSRFSFIPKTSMRKAKTGTFNRAEICFEKKSFITLSPILTAVLVLSDEK